MPRGGPEVRHRLERAALELFDTQGFDRTTSAQIAAQAGVTERTFFRHFPDKREVLFGGQPVVAEQLVTAVEQAPAALGPLPVLRVACRSLAPLMQQDRGYTERRHRLVFDHPALRERELAKLAAIAELLAAALVGRGSPARQAELAAHVGVTALRVATAAWYADGEADFAAQVDAVFDDVATLAGGAASVPSA